MFLFICVIKLNRINSTIIFTIFRLAYHTFKETPKWKNMLKLSPRIGNYFQRKGEPNHNAGLIRGHLNQHFLEYWNGNNSPVS